MVAKPLVSSHISVCRNMYVQIFIETFEYPQNTTDSSSIEEPFGAIYLLLSCR